jgi:hypothetical protein
MNPGKKINRMPKMAEQFWQDTFADLETSSYPILPGVGYHPSITNIIEHEIDRIDCTTGYDDPYTLSTKLQAAWALLLAQYANTQDVVFGTTMNYLQGNPTLQDALLPLRVPVNWESDLAQWLQANQSRVAAMQEFQSYMNLDQIQFRSPEAREAWDFRTSLLLRDSEPKVYPVCATSFTTYILTHVTAALTSGCIPLGNPFFLGKDYSYKFPSSDH